MEQVDLQEIIYQQLVYFSQLVLLIEFPTKFPINIVNVQLQKRETFRNSTHNTQKFVCLFGKKPAFLITHGQVIPTKKTLQ